MTGNAFLPGLLIFQILELVAAGYFFWRGYDWLAAGAIILLLAFTMPVWGAYSEDPKMKVNSDILTILAGYDNEAVTVLHGIRCGLKTEADYAAIKAKEAEFKKRIEFDPDDDRGIYRWKQ
jgi:hypothetical protein